MAKLTTADLATLTSSSTVSAINNNNALIEEAIENTLSRDGTAPNQMEADLDMNSNRILNLPAPLSDNEPARLVDLSTVTGGTGSGSNIDPTGLARGTLIFKGATTWEFLAPGPAGQFLKTNGAGADPSFAAVTATGGLIATNNLSDLSSISAARTNLSINNVDNTTDLNKPVSTAQQTALNLKQNSSLVLNAISGMDTSVGVVVQDPSTTFSKRPIGVTNSTDILSRADADGRFLKLIGGTLTGALVLNADPTTGLQAATKQYVDNIAVGINTKTAAKAATTANITLSGAQTIDGVSIVATDRVLVKNQTAPAENGIYVAAAGAWARSTDADAWTELVGALIFISSGTANGSTSWSCNVAAGGTLGTTAVTWVQFGASASYTAGTGLSLTGNQFAINASFSNITGSLAASQLPARTGDVTSPAGSAAMTIANDAVTNAKMANVAANTIKGRITGGTGDPEDLTAANARTVLGLGTAALSNTGTSGANVPLLSTSNTWSLEQIASKFSTNGNNAFTGGAGEIGVANLILSNTPRSNTSMIMWTASDAVRFSAQAQRFNFDSYLNSGTMGQGAYITGAPSGESYFSGNVLIKGAVPWADVTTWIRAVAANPAAPTPTETTTGIQNAINFVAAAPYNGGVVFFPPGTYIVNNTISLKIAVTLMGSGKGCTTIDSNGLDITVIQFTAGRSGSGIHEGGVERLTVRGGSGASGSTYVVYIPSSSLINHDCVHTVLRDCEFHGGYYALYHTGVDGYIENCYIHGSHASGGCVRSNGANWYIRCKIDADVPQANGFFQEWNGGNASQVAENHITQCDFSGPWTTAAININDGGVGNNITIISECVLSGAVGINGAAWTCFQGCELAGNIFTFDGETSITGCYGFAGINGSAGAIPAHGAGAGNVNISGLI